MFLKDSNSHIAVVVAEAPDAVAIVAQFESTAWDLCSLSRGSFERKWQPWEPTRHPIGTPAPVAVKPIDTLRTLITGPFNMPPAFGYGALDALATRFPEGPFHLFDLEDGFVHRFAELTDATLIAGRRGGSPILFGSETQLKNLSQTQLEAVAAALDVKQPPAKPSSDYIKELFEMAKKAKAKQAKKVRGVQARAKRADGPVAKVLALYAKASNPKDTAAMIEAAVKSGVNEATARTQLYKFRKENGIKADRGAPRKKSAKATKPARAAKAKGPAKKAKKAGTKKAKKERTPAPALEKAAADTSAPAGNGDNGGNGEERQDA